MKYDVIIVGASISGCAAATFLSQQGLKIAVVEKKFHIKNYKKLCTHILQPAAIPLLEQLGWLEAIKRAGAIKTQHAIHSEYGWIRRDNDDVGFGYNLTRKTLDPLIRTLALNLPNVDFFPGYQFHSVITNGSTVCIFKNRKGNTLTLTADLLVGADGYQSKVAKSIKQPFYRDENKRFAYFSYFHRHDTFNESRIWYLNPDIVYAFPNENEQMMLCYVGHHEHMDAFKTDVEKNFYQVFNNLPDFQFENYCQQLQPFYGFSVMENYFMQEPVENKVVLIGDAAISIDPISGLGCTWALQSAYLLAQAVKKNDIDSYYPSLKNKFWQRYQVIAHESLAKPFGQTAKNYMELAANSQRFSNFYLDFCGGLLSVDEFFNPKPTDNKMIKSEFIETNGTHLNVMHGGKGEAIVFLHGFPQTSYAWRKIYPEFIKDYRVIIPDLRGMGQSAICTHGQDKKTLADDVIGVLDKFNISQAIVIGHDWGGAVGQRLVLDYPHRVTKFICLGIPYMPHARLSELTDKAQIFHNWYFFFHQIDGLPESLAVNSGDAYIRWMFDHGAGEHKNFYDEHDIHEYCFCFCDKERATATFNLYRVLFSKDIEDWQPLLRTQIHIPTLYIRLLQDPFVPPAMLHDLDKIFTQLQLVDLDCGHWAPEEKPEELTLLIKDFVKKS